MIRYSILDPAGNITALVESPVPAAEQPAAAAALMRLHPEVEQVGFVTFSDSPEDPIGAELRMAGGEFCGNASLCAAVLSLIVKGSKRSTGSASVTLWVSGTEQPVRVRVEEPSPGDFRGCLEHPAALSITEREFRLGEVSGMLPTAELPGITHLIIRPGSPFFALRKAPAAAEKALKLWCAGLGADSLGLIFLEAKGRDFSLTPFVWVPGSGTFFRENSCASGSAAAAMVLAARTGRAVSLAFREPGGTIMAESDPVSGQTRLRVRVLLRVRASMD